MNSHEGETIVKHVLVAVDGSEDAKRAARVASTIAKNVGAELTILHVIALSSSVYAFEAPDQLNKIEERARQDAEKFVAAAASIAAEKGIKPKTSISEHMDSAVRGITDYAEKNGIDLIVVGTRGLGGFKRLILGSVASGVVHYAQCSVLVVR